MVAQRARCARCGRDRYVNGSRPTQVCADCTTTEVEGLQRGALDWKSAGSCTQTDPESFFSDLIDERRAATQVCDGCLVRAQCLEYAVEFNEIHGVWGGLTPIQRRRRQVAA